MQTFILTLHLIVTIAMIAVILLQRSEGGGLGLGGGTAGGLMTTRGAANLLTRTTGILATIFITTSLILAIMESKYVKPASLLDVPATNIAQPQKELSAKSQPEAHKPADHKSEPSKPAAPKSDTSKPAATKPAAH